MKKRILLVEDEKHLMDMVTLNLDIEGFDVTGVGDGKIALDTFFSQRFDLVILDVMLPEIDGFQVCQNIRLKNKSVPILILSAKSSSGDRVEGLKLGADDYLAKPFNLEELLLRVNNLIKRSDVSGDELNTDVYRIGPNRIHFLNYEIVNDEGSKTPLSKREAMLLKLLIEKKNQAVTREHILEQVWGYDVYPSTRTIDNFILAFRKYFEKDPKNPKHFISVRGVGYKFCE